MKKSMLVILGMLLAFSWSAFTQQRHPRMHAAHRLLGEAREELSRAEGDFRGHRARAIEHVRIAQEEVTRALEADRR